MSDQLPCPICHSTDAHKLDCQNATYVCSLLRRIRELEAEKKEWEQAAYDQVNELNDRIRELEAKLERVKKLVPEFYRDELKEALAYD